MSLFKRGNTYWIDFTPPSGQRVRCTAGTSNKAEAQQFHDKLKTESWRVLKLGDKPKYTWDQAAYRWLVETAEKKTHHEDIKKVAWLQQFFRGRRLESITRDDIAAIGTQKKAEASGPTANRYLAVIRAVLKRACNDWDWLENAPKVTLYPEAKRRVRWITPEQVKRLMTELPSHQRDVVLFALATGLRQANVAKLAWEQVDLARRTAWVYGDKAKGKEDIHVSLSQFSVEVLQRQLGKHPKAVFTYAGRPLGQVNTRGWRSALKRAEIVNFRWHDLRHTWASWHVQNGTPLYNLQEMGGWQSAEMVRRYAHLAPAHMAKHADVVGSLLCDTYTPQHE